MPIDATQLPPPAEFQTGIENYWQRMLQSIGEIGDTDYQQKVLHTLSNRQELKTVWSASEFVAQCCATNPELIYEIIESGDLDRQSTKRELANRLSDFVDQPDDEDILHRRLRQARRREMIRIAWRDLTGAAGLHETMQQVSQLADSCIQSALYFHNLWLGQRFGQPCDENGEPACMVVLGLGKLGGNELNYSSDVDLLFAFDLPGETRGTEQQKIIDNQEYFIKLGRKLVAALDPVSADGFVFRTDMRLRPNGDSGPLALSFPALEHYYQTHGRTWERYALIKARVVAGDNDAGSTLLSMLRPFVYRKYLDFGAFDAIREMKNMIERQLKQKGMEQDIKLGWGGIREVEFLLQSHQLIRGGREKQLQTNSVYKAAQIQQELGVLDAASCQCLMAGYEFLRNTEHRLQMLADRQTQILPESGDEKSRLAWTMGYANWQAYSVDLKNHRQNIHDLFKTIMQSDQASNKPDNAMTNLLALWEGSLPSETAVGFLQDQGFTDAKVIPPLLIEFQQGRLYQSFSGTERDRVDRLMPLALSEAAKHQQSARAMSSFISVLEGIGRRTAYLSLLIENPIAIKQLLHLCAASPWLSRHIGQNPVILDELIHPMVDVREQSAEELQLQMRTRLQQLDDDDEEAQMNTLREFQHGQILRIAAADVSNTLEVDDVHGGLTRLAEALLNQVFSDAQAFTKKKLGNPHCQAGVIAYGKFASAELGYHSDLDLVVCYDNDANTDAAQNQQSEHFFNRAGRRMIHLLTTRTRAGVLYELDMRLRPSGKSGTLVTSLSSFFDYQIKNAWTWEHQALVRSRVVVGSDSFRQQFEQSRKLVLTTRRDSAILAKDVIDMRRKMIDANCQSTDELYDLKLDEGGIVDIEFLLQYWILLHAHETEQLIEPRSTSEVIAALNLHGLISNEQAETLHNCYQTYLRYSLNLKLMDRPVLSDQNALLEERSAIKALWQHTFA